MTSLVELAKNDKEPLVGDVYVLTTSSFLPGSDIAELRVDVRVKAVDDNMVYCTVANRSNILPIRKDVFMRVIELVEPSFRKSHHPASTTRSLPYIPSDPD